MSSPTHRRALFHGTLQLFHGIGRSAASNATHKWASTQARQRRDVFLDGGSAGASYENHQPCGSQGLAARLEISPGGAS